MDKTRILYVEDNEINRFIIKRLLEGFGDMDVQLEATANAGLDRGRFEDFEVILLDLNLGEEQMDGFALLKILKPLKPDALFIAITAYTGPVWEERCEQAGFNAYFAKPIDGEELHSTILKLLNKSIA